MGAIENIRHCTHCHRKTWHTSQRFSPEAAMILAIVTGGLFLLLWLLISIAERNQPWVCKECSTPRGRRGRHRVERELEKTAV